MFLHIFIFCTHFLLFTQLSKMTIGVSSNTSKTHTNAYTKPIINANISCLPFVVIERILWHVTECSKDIRNWKLLVPILGVCHNWRETAIPAAYHTAYIGHTPLKTPYLLHQELENDIKNTFHNIKLAHMTDNFKHFKRLQINLCTTDAMDCFVKNLQEIMQFGKYDWSNVTTLHYEDNLNNSSYPTLMSMEKAMMRISHNLPQIVNLTIVSNPYSIAETMVHQHLVDEYASRLCHFKCNSVVQTPECGFSNVLTALSIKINDSSASIISRINTGALKRLCFTDVPHDFTWTNMNNQSDSQMIHLPNVTDLNIHFLSNGHFYDDGDDEISNMNKYAVFKSGEYHLRLPKLENLLLKNMFATMDILLENNSPKKFKKIKDLLPHEQSLWIHQSNVRGIPIRVTKAYGPRWVSKDHSPFGEALDDVENSMVETNALPNKESMLHFRNNFGLQPTYIYETSLSKLYLDVVVGVSGLTELLQLLPNLKNLQIKCFKCQSRKKPELFAINETLDKPAAPLASNLQTLSIDSYRYFEEEYVAKKLSVLIVRIKSLKSCCVPLNIVYDLNRIMKQYGDMSPHIKPLEVAKVDSQLY